MTLLLLAVKDVYGLSSKDFPAACRSEWDLARRDISETDGPNPDGANGTVHVQTGRGSSQFHAEVAGRI